MLDNYLGGISGKNTYGSGEIRVILAFAAIVYVSGDPIMTQEKYIDEILRVSLTLQAKHMDHVKVVLAQWKPFAG